MRVAFKGFGRQANFGQRLDGALVQGGGIKPCVVQGLGDDAADALARVERAVGVLKYHLKIAPCGLQCFGGQGIVS